MLKRLLSGHKRSLLWEKKLMKIMLDDGEQISLTASSLEFSLEQQIELHLPEIMKAILIQYELEKYKNKEQNRIITYNTKNWDGVIK